MPTTSRTDPHGDGRERVGVSDAIDDAFDDAGNESDADDDETAALPDYYARLGARSGATPEELRRAYLRLVKLWHPDRYTNAPDTLRARAERRMRQLNEAYDALTSPKSRTAYDAQREGHGEPLGDVINVFGQRTAAPASTYDDRVGGHASANPNGAGQFFGALAMILALGLIGGVLGGGGFGGGVGAFVVLLGIVALLVAASFFIAESPLAKWATQTMEAEPRRYAEATRRRAPSRPQPERTPPVDATPEADVGVDAATFDALIDEALTAVPHTFDEYMRNIVVRAEDEPDAETLRHAGVPDGHTLLGLYHGVSLPKRGASDAGPDVITIYRGPIARYCGGDLERIRRQVRATVLHELAHHFGIDHDDMPEWVK
ncbi:MAG TPA: metallopeptidase family protein [Ktedonobacterales bacterium]